MNKLKTVFFSGPVATALGVGTTALRMWRERGICDFGHVVEGGEDNPRSRRRYDVREVCMMGVATYLARFGYDLEHAFEIVAGSEQIKNAIAAEFFEAGEPDQIFLLADGNPSDDGSGWNNGLVLSFADWQVQVSSAFTEANTLTQEPAEVVLSVNVSAIARRVIKALRASDEG